MRYAKHSTVINPSRDIPLLRQVRNSQFVGYQQLFALLCYQGFEHLPSSFSWRVRRLLASGHMHACEKISWKGHSVYRITQKGLLELESYGHFVPAIHSQTEHPPHISQIYHALDLNDVQLALAQKNLLASWQSAVEIMAANLVSPGGYQKDYDAIIDVWVSGSMRRFALEYERTLKSADRYESVCSTLAAERQIGCVLYLGSGHSVVLHLVHIFEALSDRVVFATLRAFCQQLLQTPVVCSSQLASTTFEHVLMEKGLPFPGAA